MFTLSLLHLYLLTQTQAHVLNNRVPQSPPDLTTIPATATLLLKDDPSCLIVGEALAICGSLTSDFKDLEPTSQAKCLCYSSTAWAPSIFDSAVKSCAIFASANATSAFPALANIEGFCTSIGDAANSGPASNTAVTTASIPFPTACEAMESTLSQCAQLSPGFATLSPSIQAKCLCYPAVSVWIPTAFDNAVDSCNQVAKTAAPEVFSVVSALGGFCNGIGNLENMSAATTQQIPKIDDTSAVIIDQPTEIATSVPPIDSTPLQLPITTTNSTPAPTPIPVPSLIPTTAYSLTSFPSASSSSTTSSTRMDPNFSSQKDTTVISTTSAANRPMVKMEKTTEMEIIVVSLVCAIVLLFLY